MICICVVSVNVSEQIRSRFQRGEPHEVDGEWFLQFAFRGYFAKVAEDRCLTCNLFCEFGSGRSIDANHLSHRLWSVYESEAVVRYNHFRKKAT